MSQLIPIHVFGVKCSVKDSVQFIEDNTYFYVAGQNVVVVTGDHRHQKVLPGTPDTHGITAVALSPTKKLIALAERVLPVSATSADTRSSSLSADSRISAERKLPSETRSADGDSRDGDAKGASAQTQSPGPIITLWETGNWKKRKVLWGSEMMTGVKEYVSISFSGDGRNIAAQGCGPDWTLVLWSLEKSKVFAGVKTSHGQAEVYQVQYCPSDTSLVTVVGNGFAKTFKLTDTAFRQIATDITKREGQHFLCHTWLSECGEQQDRAGKDGCIYSCDNGELIYVEGGEIVSTISPNTLDGTCAAQIIVPYSKGFICGGLTGIVSVYEKSDEKDAKGYKKVYACKLGKNGEKINSMALSANEELLICMLENNQIMTVSFNHRELFKEDEIPKEVSIQTFHCGAIIGMDVCIRRPIAVTCGFDKSIRVWNYIERTCEVTKFFAEEAFSIALHPDGLHVLVGFSDKLRFMNLLIDDIRSAKELSIKGCLECGFSNGGQYFAAAHSNVVQVFSTYTYENLGNLRGHSGKVRSIWWSSDDTTMLTAGADGAVYEWKMKDFKRSRENVLKGCVYTCVIGTANCNSFFAVGSDKKLKELDDHTLVKGFSSAAALSQIALPEGSRLLFAGTEFGAVRSYRYPLTGEYQEVQASIGAISQLRTSCDDNLLVCAGEDGVLTVFDVKDREKALLSGSMRRDKEAFAWSEEVLITKTDLEEMRSHVQDLEEKVVELKNENEYQMRLKDLSLNEKIKNLTENFQRQIDVAQQRYNKLLQDKNEQEIELEQKILRAEEKHSQQLKDLEEQWQQKMMTEVERYSNLEHEKQMLNKRWEEKHASLVASHEQVLQELTDEFEAKLSEERNAYAQLQQELQQTHKDFEEIKRQTEEDTDQEIEELKQRYEARLAHEAETILRLKGENGLLTKKFNDFRRDIEEQKEEIKQLYEKKKELYQTLGFFERDIVALKKDVAERDETIGEKEKRIYDLKRKTQELEKVKFVMDHKIKDLKQTTEPRELELQNAKLQIANMEKELERSHNGNTKKQLSIAEMKLKLDGLQTESARLRLMNFTANTLITNFQHDFYELTQLIQEPQALKDAVIALSQKYETNKGKIMPVDEDLQKEIGRQREYLERNVANLQHKLGKDRLVHQKNHQRIMQENVILIKELNEIRKELKLIKMGGQRPSPYKSEDGSPSTDKEGTQARIKALQHELTREKENNKRLELLLERANVINVKNTTTVQAFSGEDLNRSTNCGNEMEKKIEELQSALVQRQQCITILENLLQEMKDRSDVVQINITVGGEDINTKPCDDVNAQGLEMGHPGITEITSDVEDDFKTSTLTEAAQKTGNAGTRGVAIAERGIELCEGLSVNSMQVGEDGQSSCCTVEEIYQYEVKP